MSAKTGKKYERKVVNCLAEYNVTAERVPRSVADATPVDDVVVAGSGFEPIEEDGDRPITRQLQRQEIELKEVTQVEVKYTSGGAYGVKGLYNAHLAGIGLGGAQHMLCQDGWSSGGLMAFVACVFRPLGDGAWKTSSEAWCTEDSLAKGTRELIAGEMADAAAIRGPRRPWVVVWR